MEGKIPTYKRKKKNYQWLNYAISNTNSSLMLDLISRMIPTFVHMCQFDMRL